MIDVKILKRPKQGNLISSSGGFATAGTATVIPSDCLQKLTRVLVPVDADQNELPWDAPLDKIWAVKSVKGIYSLEFLSARGLNSAESGVTGGINESELAQYLIDNNYAKKSDIPSLAGFATENWVKNQKYLTAHQSLAAYLKIDGSNSTATGVSTLSYPGINVIGHRDVKGVAKACPSFDVRSEYKGK